MNLIIVAFGHVVSENPGHIIQMDSASTGIFGEFETHFDEVILRTDSGYAALALFSHTGIVERDIDVIIKQLDGRFVISSGDRLIVGEKNTIMQAKNMMNAIELCYEGSVYKTDARMGTDGRGVIADSVHKSTEYYNPSLFVDRYKRLIEAMLSRRDGFLPNDSATAELVGVYGKWDLNIRSMNSARIAQICEELVNYYAKLTWVVLNDTLWTPKVEFDSGVELKEDESILYYVTAHEGASLEDVVKVAISTMRGDGYNIRMKGDGNWEQRFTRNTVCLAIARNDGIPLPPLTTLNVLIGHLGTITNRSTTHVYATIFNRDVAEGRVLIGHGDKIPYLTSAIAPFIDDIEMAIGISTTIHLNQIV